MSAAEKTQRTVELSPRFRAAMTAVFYLLTILMGALVLSVHGRWAGIVDLMASAFYIALTFLFYDLSRPMIRTLPLLTAFLNFLRSTTAGASQRRREMIRCGAKERDRRTYPRTSTGRKLKAI
jgi:hypothetical protein